MDMNILRGIATIVVMASFLGIFWWAYIYRSKESFNEAANLPFKDELELSNPAPNKGDQR